MSLFTSSSEGGNRRRRWPWGLAVFVLLVVLSEVLVFRQVETYGFSPGFIGQIAELEASFEAAEAARIRVAVIGDSQSMDALRPEGMAAYSAYAPEEIFNFSLSGASAFEMARVYASVADRLTGLEHAIVTVNEHQLNDALLYTESGQVNAVMFKYYAGLGDRLRVMNGENYGDLLLGWLLKSWDLRTVWVQQIEKYREGKLRDRIPVHEGGLPPVTWSPKEHRTREYAEETAERWLADYRMDGVRAAAFEALIRDLTARGVRVTVVQLPRSAVFEDVVQTEYAAVREAYLSKVRSVAARFGAEFAVMSGEGLGLEAHYRDTNHVNEAGAAVLSRRVAERWLR